ncbi:MAG: 2-C-methyl-D-erythritol 4-phosphate cytidylyltransferase [Paramuribaculum sp.]|nr:2-C-methyl-D-erythritol 4-phosphate cytidylyltransferase [Paramuribaculum sp.]
MDRGKTEYCHIVVAGGTGSRFGGDLPKQFRLLGERPVLMHTVERIRRWGRGGEVITVLSPEMRGYWQEECRKYGFEAGRIVDGGATRWHSVRNALEAVPKSVKTVSVHDGARPMIDGALMDRLLDAVERGARAVVPAIEPSDSLRELTGEGGSRAVERSKFRMVQTPQVFDRDLLWRAYGAGYRPEFTDDASVVEAFGEPVALVEGSKRNIKITYPWELEFLNFYFEKEINKITDKR